MAKKRAGNEREPFPVPQNLEEASDFLRRIGAARRAIDAAELKLNGEVERIKAEMVGEIGPYAREAEKLILGLFVFADDRRAELTDGGKKKTVQLPAGELKWRTAPPAVSVQNTELVIGRLRYLGLDRFLRTPPPEIDKEAILKEPKAVEGVKGAAERDAAISNARKTRDWEKQFLLAIDPEKPRRYRSDSRPKTDDVCSMCNEFCPIKRGEESLKK